MELSTAKISSVNVLKISGSFDIYAAGEIREWIEKSTVEAPAHIVMDMAEVNFIDSTALAILVQGMKRAREINGDIRLSGVQKPVRMVLELTRLDKVFEIYPHQMDAVRAFEQEL
jgi:anti-sigma B factor antagonist